MEMIYRTVDGRELTLVEAADLVIQEVQTDDTVGTITLELIEPQPSN